MDMLEKTFQKDSAIVSRRIADEVILVPVSRRVEQVECLYTLNEVAARAWELIDGQRTLKAVRDAIVAEFDVSEKKVEADLLALIEQFKDIGAIREVEAS